MVTGTGVRKSDVSLNGQGRESDHGGSEDGGLEHHFVESVGGVGAGEGVVCGLYCVVEVVIDGEDGGAKAFCEERRFQVN